MSDVQATPHVEYRPIEDFPGYQVGDDGSVWSCRISGINSSRKFGAWHKMKPDTNSHGYFRVRFRRDGRLRCRTIHKLVLTAFCGPRPAGMEGCHNNGDKSDCRLSNLRWDTPQSNGLDRVAQGEKKSVRFLKTADIINVKARLSAGEKAVRLAREYGVHVCTIHRINSGKTHKEVM